MSGRVDAVIRAARAVAKDADHAGFVGGEALGRLDLALNNLDQTGLQFALSKPTSREDIRRDTKVPEQGELADRLRTLGVEMQVLSSDDLIRTLEQYEQDYGMSTLRFYEAYVAGNGQGVGESMEWSSYFEMLLSSWGLNHPMAKVARG